MISFLLRKQSFFYGGIVFSFLLWITGFLSFIYYILPSSLPSFSQKTDALVVWTGGACRVATGLELLSRKVAPRLFISGIYHDLFLDKKGSISIEQGASLKNVKDPLLKIFQTGIVEAGQGKTLDQNKNKEELLKIFKKSCEKCQVSLSDSQLNDLLPHIFIGHLARTTIGNAIETGRWVEKNQIRSIRLVTSSMHLPRSLMEWERHIPSVQVIPHPAKTTQFNPYHWYKDWRVAYKLAFEYTKYVCVWLRIPLQRQNNLYFNPKSP